MSAVAALNIVNITINYSYLQGNKGEKQRENEDEYEFNRSSERKRYNGEYQTIIVRSVQ